MCLVGLTGNESNVATMSVSNDFFPRSTKQSQHVRNRDRDQFHSLENVLGDIYSIICLTQSDPCGLKKQL